ncbi:hypothetical protein OQA88_5194 [Cercophora sp. LCS_1]
MILSSLAGAIGLLAASVTAAPSHIDKRAPTPGCKFDSKTAPECWDGVFNLNSNYYAEGPKIDPSKPRVYDFKLTNITTMSPDGVPRSVLAINGQIPGPTIYAEWGETVVVNVENTLDYAGTALHFHGIRQNNTVGQDGVGSITQCPIPGLSTKNPEGSNKMTYTWVATQYGTSWYHSHYGVQAWDGMFGAIVINGPASAPYDKDLGALMLSDWTHKTSDSLLEDAALFGGGVPINNGLINGTNVYTSAEGVTTGKRFEMVFEPGKLHRIRFVNTAMDTMYKIHFDDHEMQVISSDFVSIKPFTTNVLPIAIGQRYDVIVNATRSGSHWFRAVAMEGCGQHDPNLDVRGIIRYDAADTSTPAEKTPEELPEFGTSCHDLPMASLVPSVPLDLRDVPSNFQLDHDVTFEMNFDENTSVLDWRIKGVPYYSPWEYPTLQQVLEGNTTYDPRQRVIQVDNTKEWIYALVRTSPGTTHPIHMHGHDFFILGQSDQEFDPATFKPQTVNPPRRDVAMVVDSGYIVVAFQTDNPGAWLLHCHIGWHASEGMAVTFLEHTEKIPGIMGESGKKQLEETCGRWKTFAEERGIKQHDSGV